MTNLKKCPLCLKSPSSSFYHIIYKHSYMKASFDFLIDYRKKLRTIAAIKKVEIVLFHCLEEKKSHKMYIHTTSEKLGIFDNELSFISNWKIDTL